jgi:hypothetical protein
VARRVRADGGYGVPDAILPMERDTAPRNH